MGFLAELAKSGNNIRSAGNQGRSVWLEVFESTNKDEGLLGRKPKPDADGGSYVRSLTLEGSLKRLLEALRARAPGGWSDDRYEQTLRHFKGIVYVGIHRVGTQLQQAEYNVYVKDRNHPDGKREVMEDDPPHGNRFVKPYDLVKLLGRPNTSDSFGKLMYRWNQQQMLTGTALTWMVPNRLGTPMELYSIPTAMAMPQPVIRHDYPKGYWYIQPIYPAGPFSTYPSPASTTGAIVPNEWMLRFQYPHPFLFYEGYSPLTAMSLHIDEVESMDRSRWYAMKRGINPSAVLNFDDMEDTIPLPEEEIERIRADFENYFQGSENTGRLLVSTPGARLEPWGARPIDMDYTAGWDQLVSFVLGGGFGITKPAAGMIEDSSYSTLFATLKQLYLITLDPICTDIASELTHHLAPHFGDGLIVEVRCKRIDDHEVKNAKLNVLITGRAVTKNELRKECDMPVTEEEWGNDIAGDPSPAEQEMAEQDHQRQQESLEKKQVGDEKKIQANAMAKQQLPPSQREESKEVNLGRPRTGRVGRGSLGPKKALHLNGNGRLKTLTT